MRRLDIRRAIDDARALFARDRDLLIRLAGVLFFLPSFAGLLFLPAAVAETGQTANQVLLAWFAENAHWLMAEQAVLLLGGGTFYRLYLDPARPPLGVALQRAAAGYLSFLLATLLATLSVFAGLALFILPGAYLLGRTAMAAPAVVAEGKGAMAALERSFTVTKGQGWVLFGVQALILVVSQLAVVLLSGLDGNGTGLASALVDAAAAVVGTAATMATLLFKIAAWRQLGSSSGT